MIDEQLAGHVEGLDILRGAIGGMEKGYSRFQNVPKEMVVQGNNAAVVSHISAANAAGEPIEAEVTNYFQFRDGKISYMANFHDTRPFDPFVNQDLLMSELRLHRRRHRLGRLVRRGAALRDLRRLRARARGGRRAVSRERHEPGALVHAASAPRSTGAT